MKRCASLFPGCAAFPTNKYELPVCLYSARYLNIILHQYPHKQYPRTALWYLYTNTLLMLYCLCIERMPLKETKG